MPLRVLWSDDIEGLRDLNRIKVNLPAAVKTGGYSAKAALEKELASFLQLPGA